MPITVAQTHGNISGTESKSQEVKYLVRGTQSYDAALAALKEAAPLMVGYYKRGDCSLTLRKDTLDVWDATVPYNGLDRASRPRKPLDVGQEEIRFRTTGGMVKVYRSLATSGSYAPSGQTAPNFYGEINVVDGVAEGADIHGGGFEFQITKCFPAGTITNSYLNTLLFLSNPPTTNANVWRVFDADTILFLGAEGGRRGDDNEEITFFFLGGFDETNISIGSGAIIVTSKKAHHLLHTYSVEVKDGLRKARKPIAAYTEMVYNSVDWSGLGV